MMVIHALSYKTWYEVYCQCSIIILILHLSVCVCVCVCVRAERSPEAI